MNVAWWAISAGLGLTLAVCAMLAATDDLHDWAMEEKT